MEMAHNNEMAMIHKEAAAAGNKGSVSDSDGIPKVNSKVTTRSSAVLRCLALLNTLISFMLIFSVLNSVPRIRAGKNIIVQFF